MWRQRTSKEEQAQLYECVCVRVCPFIGVIPSSIKSGGLGFKNKPKLLDPKSTSSPNLKSSFNYKLVCRLWNLDSIITAMVGGKRIPGKMLYIGPRKGPSVLPRSRSSNADLPPYVTITIYIYLIFRGYVISAVWPNCLISTVSTNFSRCNHNLPFGKCSEVSFIDFFLFNHCLRLGS